MGAALYIVLEKEMSDLDTMIDGKALSQAEPELTRACQRLGVRPLMEFFSADAEDLSDFLGEGEGEVEVPAEQWFSAQAGLKTIQALLGVVDASPEFASAKTDLQGFERVLKEAEKHGIRWHLAVDY